MLYRANSLHKTILPMSSVEKDPFITGLESTIIAIMFPMMPKMEMDVSIMPTMTNSNIVVSFWPNTGILVRLELESLRTLLKPSALIES